MRKNIATTLLTGIVIISATSCTKEVFNGNGPVVSDQRNVSGFTAVNTTGQTNVIITQGTNYSVTVKAFSNLVPQLRTEVHNGTLKIYYPDRTRVNNDNSEVFIVMPSLNGLITEGSGNLKTKGNWNSIGTLSADIAGSGNITIEDTAAITSFTANLRGSGNVYALKAVSQHADIDISGSSNVELGVEQKLNVNINGSGTVTYKGSPEVTTRIKGSGTVRKL